MAGWSRSRIAFEHSSLRSELASLGVSTALPAIFGHVARLSGVEDEQGFAARLQHHLLTCEANEVSVLMDRFNGQATVPRNTIAFRPFRPVLAAVGN